MDGKAPGNIQLVAALQLDMAVVHWGAARQARLVVLTQTLAPIQVMSAVRATTLAPVDGIAALKAPAFLMVDNAAVQDSIVQQATLTISAPSLPTNTDSALGIAPPATTAVPTQASLSVIFTYYYYTITYYYISWYWTLYLEESTSTYATITTFTTISIYDTDSNAAYSSFLDVSETLTLSTPEAANGRGRNRSHGELVTAGALEGKYEQKRYEPACGFRALVDDRVVK
ncbi:hypothetical protein D0Z07_3029 [Hyphodiscus hymeniophilus]|uniref:Uncharacterized protein n=1 Tax=Hyphodiscus hymeniophilus TaxID=353542 RepID=A0A9P6VLR0_9HELO|nr:hypothetical protein D0Z07_3029 [Hyphodiscus hymeniophilus]